MQQISTFAMLSTCFFGRWRLLPLAAPNAVNQYKTTILIHILFQSYSSTMVTIARV